MMKVSAGGQRPSSARRYAWLLVLLLPLGGRLIPYVAPPPPLSFAGLSVSIFAVCVFGSVVAMYAIIVVRGRLLVPPHTSAASPSETPFAGASVDAPDRFAQVLLGAGMFGAHVGGTILDHGSAVLKSPKVLLSSGGTFSSAAGLLSAMVAGFLYLHCKKLDKAAWADVAGSAFCGGLFVARLGCALVHDHLGRRSTSMFAVAFPDGGRFDCGLLEWLFSLFLFTISCGIARRRWPVGVLAASVGATYAVFRFCLDFLRATDIPQADPRGFGLTLAQWLCVPLLMGSLALGNSARARVRP